MKDLSFLEQRLGELSDLDIFDQFRSQQRREDAERVEIERMLCDWAESGGVNGNSGDGKVVIVDGQHVHRSEQSAERVQLFRFAHPDGPVTFHAEPAGFRPILSLGLDDVCVRVIHQRY